MEKVLPQNLNYSQLKPVGYPSQIKQEKFTPVSFTSATMSDIIRFNINTNGFWDPYSAYIKIEVDTWGMDAVGVQQLDNSAHSFINQLIISNQGTEIERIEEYDTLAAILVDMNYGVDQRGGKKFEGITAQPGIINNQTYNMSVQTCITPQMSTFNLGAFHGNFLQNVGPSGLNSQSNITNLISTGKIKTLTDVKRYEYNVCNYSQQTVDKLGDKDPAGLLNFQNTDPVSQYEPNKKTDLDTNVIGKIGYRQPFNYSLTSSSGAEEVLTSNYISNVTYKGLLGKQAIKQKATFCIPLISGLLGILMPRDSYKYIPMKALQNLILEFRLNPFAMFTSGYQDTAATVKVETINQIRRFWKFTKFEINVEMQYFEQNVENIILSQLNTDSGIILHTSSWQLGPRYSIPPNSSPNGIYQVNLGFESLRNVIWFFMPDDFQTYNYCRKQYRLSANITQYYLKIGTEYYPNLPITGHGGNPLTYGNLASGVVQTTASGDTDFNNSEFLINLYKSFGKYQDVNAQCFVDPNNFAVNERAYNPTVVGRLVEADDKPYENLHTAAGLPLFHEQRCVGKAIYALNLEQLNNDFSVISGINTINNRPFEINLKSDNTNSTAFTRPYTMYVFCQYDMLVQLKMSGVQVLGRG